MHIVLLPGLDGTGLLFSRFVSALGPNFEATVVSYPDHQALDYAQHESIARASLPRDGPFILLAESFSGPIAISLAASQPPGLVGLILCCTFARNPLHLYARFKSLLGLVPFNLIPKVFQSPFLLGRFSTHSLRIEHRASVSRVSNEALRARIRAIFEVDVSARLQQITLPILYLRASADHVIPRRASEHILRIMPAVRLVEFEAPHLLLQALPSATAQVVTEFAQGLTGNGDRPELIL
jgi:pimeloyl-ACP methyl ester carboxylesterase